MQSFVQTAYTGAGDRTRFVFSPVGRKLRFASVKPSAVVLIRATTNGFGSSPYIKQKREAKASLFYMVQLSNPYPNRSHHQTQAQCKRVAAEKEEQRRECALTFEKSRSKRYKACSDVVPVTGLEPVRRNLQGILSPWCLPFHHTGWCMDILAFFSCNVKKISGSFVVGF